MSSLKAPAEETEPAPTEEKAGTKDCSLSLTVAQKAEHQLQLPAMENTLDLSVIKMSECPKFETVDTRYDFTKQRAVVPEQTYVEEGVAQSLLLPQPLPVSEMWRRWLDSVSIRSDLHAR